MNEYFVTWSIDIYADSPEEAAKIALRIQRDVESDAVVFEVINEDGSVVLVDLLEQQRRGY